MVRIQPLRTVRPPTLEVYPDSGARWRWRIRSANKRIVAASGESFSSKSKAVRAVISFVGSLNGPVDAPVTVAK